VESEPTFEERRGRQDHELGAAPLADEHEVTRASPDADERVSEVVETAMASGEVRKVVARVAERDPEPRREVAAGDVSSLRMVPVNRSAPATDAGNLDHGAMTS
jgi:hypothetical protein